MSEYPNITNIKNMQKHRGNMQKYTAGGVAMFVLIMALSLCRFGPAAAQVPTVTPFPGPAMTATAAAQSMATAQHQQRQGAQMKAEADAARLRAAQLEAQGNDAIAQGAASYQSAAQDAASATAALQAQQIGIAQEFISRALANIETGSGQIDSARSVISELRGIVNTQASAIISLTLETQTLRTQVQGLQKEAIALIDRQAIEQRQEIVGNIFFLLVVVAFLFGLFALGWQIIKIRSERRDPPAGPPPHVAGGEVIDGEILEEDEP